MLRTLPDGWQHIRAESEHEPDLSQIDWTREEIAPVPEHLKKVVYLVGRGVRENADRTELFFDYRWSFRVHGREPTPILRVVRPALVGDSFELREDNVVTAQATQAFGKYKLIGVISTGGMGTVWRGVDRFGNVLAIKILHATQTLTETQLKRFRREAEIMARLPHRNICRVYEMNEFDGIQYIAMEYVDGLPLSDLLYEGHDSSIDFASGTAREIDLRELIRSLRSRSPQDEPTDHTEASPRPKETRILPIEQTLSLIIKICDAIQFAHEHGVLHRDLKPGNILLREDGEPLVADFGLAKLKSGERSRSLSLTGHVVGTLENMAPEQAESSKDVDERADVYGIGTILYQMLTGRRHFEATGNIVKDAQTLRTHEPVRPRVYNPQIHPDLEIITLKALRNTLAERYRSVAALRADIDHYRRGEVIGAKPVSPVDLLKKLVLRNKVVSAVGAASLLVIGAGVLISIYFLDAKLKEANAQYSLIEERLQVATKREQDARQEAAAAKSEKARAEEVLAETRNALEVSKRDVEDTRQAQTEMEATGKISEETEMPASERQAAPTPTVAPDQPLPQDRVVMTDIPPEADDAPWQPMMEASKIFNVDLAEGELRRLERTPQEVVNRLVQAMDKIALALSERPGSGDAWMLKGRLHLALMEFGLAAESFREAEKAEDAPSDSDTPRKMLELVTSTAWPEKFVKAADVLQESSLAQNQTAGNTLRLLNSKRRLHKVFSDSPGPLRRQITGNEAALEVVRRNGPGTRVFVEPSSAGRVRVIVWNSPEIKDLSPLLDIEVSGLAAIGAGDLDWKTILSLPVEELDLSECVLETIPQKAHGFLRVRSLKLANSGVSVVDFVRNMPLLETLDLSSTRVTDLSPLLACRSLRHLNLAGLNPANPRALMHLPIESLTLSPALIEDRKGLDALRLHRTLKVLRSPEDPADQPAAVFWRRLDEGGYDQVQ
jgi:serine/threonine protein kinase